MPHAEIVDGHGEPRVVDTGEDMAFRLIGIQRARLRNFHFQQRGRQIVTGRDVKKLLREGALQLEGRHVDRHPKIRDSGVEPALAHLTGRLEDPQPDGSDERNPRPAPR